jgi:hypothetical protein
MAANDPITASAPSSPASGAASGTAHGSAAAVSQRGRRALRRLARRAMWRLAPAYGRRRAQRAGEASALQRLREDFDHLSERHDERLERLEELSRELVLTAEALRREIARGNDRGER